MTTRAGDLTRAATERLDRLVGGPARRHVVLVFAAVLALDSADKATIGVNATKLQQGLGIDRSQIGLLLAVSSLVGAAATIPAGALVDRVCRTRLLAWAVACWAGAMILSGVATGYLFLLLSRVALGCVTAAAAPAIASMVGDYFPRNERGRIYGYVLSGELIGAGFGFVVAGEFANLSWRAPFLVLAVPSALVCWLVLRLPEPERGGASRLPDGADGFDDSLGDAADTPDADEATADLTLWQAVRHVLSIRTNVVLIVASALGYFYFSCLRGFGVEFVQKHYHVGQSTSSLVILLLGTGALAGVLTGGRLADRLRERGRRCARIEVPGVAVPLSGLLFIPALITTTLWLAILLLIVAALFLGMSNPPLDAARLDIMRPELWGRAEAVRSVLRSSADAIAPVLFGVISESVFVGPRALEYTFLLMLITMFAAGAVVLTIGRRTFPGDLRNAERARR
ncbi:MAG TPA: MFS transporter [Jatrophihabitantaceae bacterium]|jgi:MFS family permease|nr:MFS transporter [Jatrophihabitantaceae bacterium]